jgi:cytochrome c oxidase assembly factor CtaG
MTEDLVEHYPATQAATKPMTRLLVLGLLFYLVCVGMGFDCYFRSPIVHGIQLFDPGFSLAKVLVLIVDTRRGWVAVEKADHLMHIQD